MFMPLSVSILISTSLKLSFPSKNVAIAVYSAFGENMQVKMGEFAGQLMMMVVVGVLWGCGLCVACCP